MAISVKCTNASCAATFPRPETDAGRTALCPACGRAVSVPQPEAQAHASVMLGHYRIIRPLARGGMGEIFEAVHTRFHRKVALKVLAPHLARDPEALQRFKREAQLAAAIRHPNVVTVYDFGQVEERCYLAMEFIEGEDLASHVAQKGRLAFGAALNVVEQIAAALGEAHSRGIIHRDVKPANILLTRDGTAKLTDLGLARRLEETMSLTLTQVSLGTPDFISPEQAVSARRVDHRADIYSLGVTLLYLLTGRRPFALDSRQAVIAAHINQPMPSGADLGTELPQPIEDLLHRMTAKQPDQRYPDCRALIADVENIRKSLVEGR